MKKGLTACTAVLLANLASPVSTEAAGYDNWTNYANSWTNYANWGTNWTDYVDDATDDTADDAPASGSHPKAKDQHYWQSRGNILGDECGAAEDSAACDEHQKAVAYARAWARYVRPGCTAYPRALRKKSAKRQETQLMLRMYVALSTKLLDDTDDTADTVWKNNRGLNKWCPGLRDANTEEVTYP